MAAMTNTDEQGSYRFANLRQGEYKLLVDLPFVNNEAPHEITVEQESQIKTVDFTLQKNLLVAGKKTIPAAPEKLLASEVDQNFIKLSWEDQSDDESSFLVEKSTDEGPFEALAEVPENIQEFMDEAIEEGKKYTYRVQAQNEFGKSAYSNTVSLTKVLTSLKEITVVGAPIVYPNPLSNDHQFFIRFFKGASSSANIGLFNSIGEPVTITKIDIFDQDHLQISTVPLSIGIYFLLIEIDNFSYSYRLINN
jgi:hypothetical protein